MTIITKGMGAVIKKVAGAFKSRGKKGVVDRNLSLIHISEPTRPY